MPSRTVREVVAHGCEWTAMVLAVAAMASGMVLGGGSSAVARSVLVALAAASFAASLTSMVFEGRFRIVRAFIWVPIVAMLAIGAVQMMPSGAAILPFASPGWPSHDASIQAKAISLDRGATLSALVYLLAATLLVFVVAAHVRTMGRLAVVVGLLAAVLSLTGIVGFVQTIAGRPALAGFVSTEDPKLPEFVREVYSARLANGLFQYSGWSLDTSQPSLAFFVPASGDVSYFGGMIESTQWGLCVAALAPLLLAVVVHLSGFAGLAGFRTHGHSKLSLALWLAATGMTAGATWFIDPILIPAAALASACLIVALVARRDRRQALKWCGAAVVVTAAVFGLRCAVHGVPDVESRFQSWSANADSMVRMAREFPWLGCGLGVAPAIWPAFRSSDATGASGEASSAMALAAEVGVVGIVVVAIALVYAVGRVAWVFRRLDGDGKAAVAGALASLATIVFLAVFCDLSSAPVSMGLSVLAVACLARGVAGGFRDEEALFPQ